MTAAADRRHHPSMAVTSSGLSAGVLLCNLGTPAAPTARALRPFLRQFLSDPRVVELPRAWWLPILHGFVLPFRPRKSAALYEKIWTPDGSPLLLLSRRVREGVERGLREEEGARLPVELGMRYGEPSIAQALARLRDAGCERILVLPLYPQYSASTAASTFDAVWDVLETCRLVPEVRTIREYGGDPSYIEALARSVEEVWQAEGPPDTLLLSFHGIPQRYHDAGDPYPEQCRHTARLLRERLGLPESRCQMSFQSVFGREKWIGPATDATVRRLAAEGVERLDVVCPGFSVDCLETLEEIDGLNREIFLEHGGKRFRYIPCLNDRADHIDLIVSLLRRHLHGWVEPELATEGILGGW